MITEKWTRLVIAADPVTASQAADIAVRTTWWPKQHDDLDWNASLNGAARFFGMPTDPSPSDGGGAEFVDRVLEFAEWEKNMGLLSLFHLNNDCVFDRPGDEPMIGGWVDPDGVIGRRRLVLGKWARTEVIAEEFGIIAETFPYLRLHAQVSEHRGGMDTIVGQWTLRRGQVSYNDDPAEPLSLLTSPPLTTTWNIADINAALLRRWSLWKG